MTSRQIVITVIALGLFAAALNWSLYGFVIGNLGGPAPCEVSNTCGWLR